MTKGQKLVMHIIRDAQEIRRLKALATKRNMRYHILLEQFVLERLSEEEKREGLVGGTDHDR